MATTAFLANNLTDLALESFFLFNAEAGTAAQFKLMLLGAGFTPSKTYATISQIVSNEVSGAGYTAGGNVITITVGNVNNTLNETRAECPGSSWPNASFSVKAAMVYKVKAGNSTHQIVGTFVYDTLQIVTGTTFFVGAFEIPLKNLGTLPA